MMSVNARLPSVVQTARAPTNVIVLKCQRLLGVGFLFAMAIVTNHQSWQKNLQGETDHLDTLRPT